MPTPTLHLDRTALIFNDIVGGSGPASQTVNLTNSTSGTLTFTATSDQSWLGVSPGSGTATTSPTEVVPLTITVSTGALTLGAYVGHITVTAAQPAFGTPQIIVVTFNVGGATLGGFALIGAFTPLPDPS